jgi:hypothetical protein
MEAKMAYMTNEEAKALATHRTPAELAAEMVREQLAVATA